MKKHIKDFEVGTKIELSIRDPIEGKLDINFISQIESFKDEQTILIFAPIFEAKVYPVKIGSLIEGFMYQGNYIYKFSGTVIERMVIDTIAFLEVSIVEGLYKTQRRQYFRFESNVAVSFYKKTDDDSEEIIKIDGNTKDLSGGGASTITKEPLEDNAYLDVELLLSDDLRINLIAVVLRCESIKINEEKNYLSSLKFTNIDYKDRERIVAYIFNQQRILLKKGLR